MLPQGMRGPRFRMAVRPRLPLGGVVMTPLRWPVDAPQPASALQTAMPGVQRDAGLPSSSLSTTVRTYGH